MIVIALNGPILSGKDYVAGKLAGPLIEEGYSVHTAQFKSCLYEWVSRFYNIPMDDLNGFFQRERKEMPCIEFNGLSPRQAIIHVSENVIKPMLGSDYIAEHTVRSILKQKADVVIVSDIGFQEEMDSLEGSFGPPKCLLIKIATTRDGIKLTYGDNDSRNYVTAYRSPTFHLSNKYFTSGDPDKNKEPDLAPILDYIRNNVHPSVHK